MSLENKYISVEEYLRKLSGLHKEVKVVDHTYVKAWDAHPDSHRTKPARLLYMKGLQRYPVLSDSSNLNDEIDIETCDEPLQSPFDNPKMKALVTECERSLKNSQLFKEEEESVEIDLSIFTSNQRKFYQQVMGVLNSNILEKLSYSGAVNELVKRRLGVDKAARQMRQLFGMIFWNMDLLAWLHKTLLNHCDLSTISTYVDVLQTLKSKVPTLVERILETCAGSVVGDTVIQVMKKPWDPVLPVLNQNKPKKLPGNAIILICPSAPNQNTVNAHSQRLRYWFSNMSSICKVMNISLDDEDGKVLCTIEECLEQMMTCIRAKIAEIKNHYPNRPLILLGWTLGALLACHIALQEPIDGVICLGFPLTGVNGSRGDLNDPLLDIKVPTLFIVGQNARTSSTDDIEDFRSRMRAETGLVVVGGADDLLRMCPTKMRIENVTQAIVDRSLLDEVGEFVMSVVVKLPSTSAARATVQTQTCTPIKEEAEGVDEDWIPEKEGKRRRRKPREYSPELSPVRKRARHYSSRQTAIASKPSLSPLSCESSCSGPFAVEKTTLAKPPKKVPGKRIGRPTAGTWRKRMVDAKKVPEKIIATPTAGTWHKRRPGRPIKNTCDAGNPTKKISKFDEVLSPSKTTSIADSRPLLPFSKNILPKKNDPVDVEKAFGSDSSFLPRPLTPPEPEDTNSAEETEKAMAELEAMGATSDPQTPKSLLGDIINNKKAFLPISDSKEDAKPAETTATSSEKNITTISISKAESKPISLTVTPSMKSIFSQRKVLNPNSLLNFKNAGGISLLGTNVAPPSGPYKSTIITVPKASAATLLASSSALKTQQAKMIHLLTKGSFAAKTTSLAAASSSTTATKQSSERQACNLSLLSDVAGMTGPMNNSKKTETVSSAATLVKLAIPENKNLQAMKNIKVIKAVRTPSTRVESAEELVEKQLAIQALNKSIGIESHSNLVKESGYSICYAKADGSIVSQSVTRPGFSNFVQMPLANQGRRRGRGRPPINNKPFRFGQM